MPTPPPPPLDPGYAWEDRYKITVEYLFCGDEPDTDVTTPGQEKDVGTQKTPGEGPNSGGITSWDHDGDPSTPEKLLVPGTGQGFDYPDGNNVMVPFEFLPDELNPDDITGISTVQLNPCAAATCTAQETLEGKDNLPDVVFTTGTGKTSYTALNDPNSPGTLKPPKSIGSNEHDDRDVEVADINGDGVPDLIVASYDQPSKIFYGDPARPGDYENTKHDELGEATDGAIAVEVVDVDGDPSTPPEIFIANENTFDHMYVGQTTVPGSGAGTGLLDSTYTKIDIPDTDTSTTSGLAVKKGIGTDATSTVVVLTNSNGADQVMELRPTRPSGLADGTAPIATSDVLTLDASTTSVSSDVKIDDVNDDGIPDIVIVYENAGVSPAAIYSGTVGSALTSGTLPTKVNIPASASGNPITGVEVEIVDSDGDGSKDAVEVIDSTGGIYHYPFNDAAGGTSFDGPIYADPNEAVGSTTPPTTPHNVKDTHGAVQSDDFDGDGFKDLIAGNLIYLSTQATTKGDFSTVEGIAFDHGAAPLAVQTGDFDNDGDIDLFVLPGPSGNTGVDATGGEVPYIIFNRGDGVLDASLKKELAGVPPSAPNLPFVQEPSDVLSVQVGPPGTTAPVLVLKNSDVATPLMVLKAGGGSTPDDWASTTVTTITGAIGEPAIEDMQAVDIDGDGVQEIVVASADFVRIYSTSDAGSSWSLLREITRPSGSPFSAIHVADVDKDGQKDLVIGKQFGFSQIYWGSTVLPGTSPTLLELSNFEALRSAPFPGHPLNIPSRSSCSLTRTTMAS